MNVLVYTFKEKETADAVAGPDNYLYFLYQAVIENDDNEEDVYFAFVYSDGYVTSQEYLTLSMMKMKNATAVRMIMTEFMRKQ